jgi:hypothetical protein
MTLKALVVVKNVFEKYWFPVADKFPTIVTSPLNRERPDTVKGYAGVLVLIPTAPDDTHNVDDMTDRPSDAKPPGTRSTLLLLKVTCVKPLSSLSSFDRDASKFPVNGLNTKAMTRFF